MKIRTLILASAASVLPFTGVSAARFTFPVHPTLSAEEITPLGTFAVPVGPFTAGAVQEKEASGRVVQRVWKIPVTDSTTMQILAPLRAQLSKAGYSIVFQCKDQACGGFDFRFGIEVLPEPEMHVDLGDFRFLTARRMGPEGLETICLLVSKSDQFGYIQVARIGQAEAPVPVVAKSTMSPPVSDPVTPTGPIGVRLEREGSVLLDDVTFATGSAKLSDKTSASLSALAAYLTANPSRSVVLVGHTDAKGSLAGNIALSKRRAQAVAAILVKSFNVNAHQVAADGVGYLAPMTTNLTDKGRKTNRRVAVVLASTH